MKNTFLLLSAGLLFSIAANAQSKKKTSVAKLSVPEVVETSFQSNYSTIQSNKWSKNFSGNYVASFVNENNLQQTTEFNGNGVLLKTKTIFDVTALPQNVATSIETKYAGSTIETCEKVEIPGVAPFYKVKLVTADTKNKEILLSNEGDIARS
ncbi:MAG TPA: hypothetical protein PK504_00475 [Ferruginibacter sp.]|nr:hypothetical protein [Ferruginibacter sp.]HRE62338.1 hypothetical protein [Ferruginibacter sp.]